MIQISNISFSYGKTEAVKNVSFAVQTGECVGVLGNNGSGKSTLITCINKIRTPKTGSVFIDEKDIHKMLGKENMLEELAALWQDDERVLELQTILLYEFLER